MREFISHAGRGQRLAPLTEEIPKGFIPLAGRSAVERIVDASEEISEKYINISSGDLLIQQYIEKLGLPLHQNLSSGYLMKDVVEFLEKTGEPLLLWWGDTIASVNVSSLIQKFTDSQAQGAMALWHTKDTHQLKHWGSVTLNVDGFTERHPVPDNSGEGYIKAGVFIFNPSLARRMRSLAPSDWDMSFIINSLLYEGVFIGVPFEGYRININYGDDVLEATKAIGIYEAWDTFVASSSNVGEHVQFQRHVVIEDAVTIENNVVLDNCILLEGARIQKGSIIRNSIIGPYADSGIDARIDTRFVSSREITPLSINPY